MIHTWGVVKAEAASAASTASLMNVVMELEMKLMVIAELLFFSLPLNETGLVVRVCTEDVTWIWRTEARLRRTQQPNRRSPSRHQWHLRIQKTVLRAQTRLYSRLSLHWEAACLPLLYFLRPVRPVRLRLLLLLLMTPLRTGAASRVLCFCGLCVMMETVMMTRPTKMLHSIKTRVTANWHDAPP